MGKDCIDYAPAKMNKALTLQERTRVPDGQGGFSEVWSDVSVVWGSIEPMKAYERFQAQQMETPASHKIMTRYDSRITTAHRLVFETRVMDIKEVINLNEDNMFLKLIVIEKQ